MSQPWYNVTEFGSNTTSSGQATIKSGPTFLHAINVLTSAVGSYVFYNATTSSTGSEVVVLNPNIPRTYIIDAVCSNGLTKGITTSTAELTVSWS